MKERQRLKPQLSTKLSAELNSPPLPQIPKYECLFYWPYKLKKFEKELAKIEVGYLLNVPIIKTKKGLKVIMGVQPPIDKLEKLSSFHTVEIKSNDEKISLFADIAILERSAPLLRMCKDEDEIVSKIQNLKNIPLPRREKLYSLHGLHPYKGRYYPQLIRPLLNISVRRGERILDPFCGCGTTLLEAYFTGINSVGIDLNPIAYFISKVKIECLSIKTRELRLEVDQLLQECKRKISRFRCGHMSFKNVKVPEIPNLEMWFSKGALEELSIIMEEIKKVENQKIRDFFLLTLGSIVKKVSNWDPKQVRQRLLKAPRKGVRVLEIFEKRVKDYYLIAYTYAKLKAASRINSNVSCEVYQHDSRHLEFLEDESFDGIITSPPYATALPYLDTDRLPMYVLGVLNPKQMKDFKEIMIGERDITPKKRDELEEEFLSKYDSLPLPLATKKTIREILHANKFSNVGFRRKNVASTLYRYFMGMRDCIHEMSRLIKPGGLCSIIIGDNRTKAGGKDTIWIETHKFLVQMAEQEGFNLLHTIRMAPTPLYTVYADKMIKDEYVEILKKAN